MSLCPFQTEYRNDPGSNTSTLWVAAAKDATGPITTVDWFPAATPTPANLAALEVALGLDAGDLPDANALREALAKHCGCKNTPARFARTYNADGVLGVTPISSVDGYDEIIDALGCEPAECRKIGFQGAVYIDCCSYPYAVEAMSVPTTPTAIKRALIFAMNQAVAGTGVSFRIINGFIEMRGPNVDMAWTAQKLLADSDGDWCMDDYFVFRSDVSGTYTGGDAINSPVSNPYDPLAVANYQSGTTGNV